MKGFTLIEMIVVIGITIFLTSMTLLYNRSSEGQVALFKDESVVVGVLNRAKALALQKYKQGTVSACAFGVFFDAQAGSFLIFQDLDTDGDLGNGCGNGEYDVSNQNEQIETFALDRRVEFFDFSSKTSSLTILFQPPYLEATKHGTLGLRVKAEPSVQKKIEVGAGGNITSL